MILLPIRTALLRPGDDLAATLKKSADIRPGDIIVLSSKAVATVENAAIDLGTMTVSPDARTYAKKTGRSAAFMEAVLRETQRMHGQVRGTAPGAVVTELQPSGMMQGSLLVPNAGLDESNIGEGWTVGWPLNPVESLRNISSSFSSGTSASVAFVLTDSCCVPGRRGVTAFALAVHGIEPFRELRGEEDLFGKQMRITVEAVADQLATAANMIMGNSHQSTPAVIMRGHDLSRSDFYGWVPAMDRAEDLFKDLFR